jgi:shikimate dehydrogenase
MIKKYGLIGYPLGHSFSKKYFSDKFQKEKLTNCVYKNFEIEDVKQLYKVVRDNPDLIGLNVTIPHKQAVIELLDELDEQAEAIGAVNTIRIIRQDGKVHLKGFNTDVIGFGESLKKLIQPHHKRALILGTGGASKAIAYVLGEMDIHYQYVSRSKGKGDLTYQDITTDLIKMYTLIINTTPMGMHPNADQAPELPYADMNELHLLYDLIYNPEETAFMTKGKKYGAQIKNGLDMLIGQAEAALKIWNK